MAFGTIEEENSVTGWAEEDWASLGSFSIEIHGPDNHPSEVPVNSLSSLLLAVQEITQPLAEHVLLEQLPGQDIQVVVTAKGVQRGSLDIDLEIKARITNASEEDAANLKRVAKRSKVMGVIFLSLMTFFGSADSTAIDTSPTHDPRFGNGMGRICTEFEHDTVTKFVLKFGKHDPISLTKEDSEKMKCN